MICRYFVLLLGILLFWGGNFWGGNPGYAGPLSDRLAQFPNWTNLPPTRAAQGDLLYPNWFEGTWSATSTLVDVAAPLAPEIVTPGFEGNRQSLNQPFTFLVRFGSPAPWFSRFEKFLALPRLQTGQIVADRAFNGLNIGRAYGGDAIVAVQVDPRNPNQQITQLQDRRQLVSIVSQRATETPNPSRFITTEISQQIFRGFPNPYLNIVETTTDYHYQTPPTGQVNPTSQAIILADQVTAIYLSPNDPDYFKVGDRPVSLYRYQLQLELQE